MTIIPKWFVKRRGIATGIAMAGMGLGEVISPLLAQWLISAYGWRQAFVALGLITVMVVVPVAQFMRHSPQRVGLKPYGGNEILEDEQPQSSATEGLSFSRAIRTSRFWLFSLIQTGFFFCMSSMMVHIVPHATDIGIAEVMAASILSITAGVSIIGRLSTGFISDRVGGTLTLSACLSLLTLSLIWLLFAEEIWTFYLFAVLCGLGFGGLITLLPVVAAELFGLESLGVILGGTIFVGTIGDALGAPVSGMTFDIIGSYDLAFKICVVICAGAVILSLVLLRYKGKTAIARK